MRPHRGGLGATTLRRHMGLFTEVPKGLHTEVGHWASTKSRPRGLQTDLAQGPSHGGGPLCLYKESTQGPPDRGGTGAFTRRRPIGPLQRFGPGSSTQRWPRVLHTEAAHWKSTKMRPYAETTHGSPTSFDSKTK